MDWLIQNWIEVVGAVLGFVFVYFEIKAHLFVWPASILSSLFYTVVFFQAGFFAESGLQIYFALAGLYGWWKWLRFKQDNDMTIKRFPLKSLPLVTAVCIIIFICLNFILKKWTTSPVPLQDALLTTLNILGTWLLAKKFMEHWWIWILVNFLSTIVFYSRSLYPTSVLYLTFFILSFVGLTKWKKLSEAKTI